MGTTLLICCEPGAAFSFVPASFFLVISSVQRFFSVSSFNVTDGCTSTKACEATARDEDLRTSDSHTARDRDPSTR